MFRIRYALAASVLAGIIGCSQSQGPFGQSPSSDQQAQLAAYAASNEFPANMQASSDMPLAATIAHSGDLVIRNFSDKTLRDVRVWVNSSYVRQVDAVPAHGSVLINRAQFFNSAGRSMDTQNVTVDRVQIQEGDHLYNLWGPQME